MHARIYNYNFKIMKKDNYFIIAVSNKENDNFYKNNIFVVINNDLKVFFTRFMR